MNLLSSPEKEQEEVDELSAAVDEETNRILDQADLEEAVKFTCMILIPALLQLRSLIIDFALQWEVQEPCQLCLFAAQSDDDDDEWSGSGTDNGEDGSENGDSDGSGDTRGDDENAEVAEDDEATEDDDAALQAAARSHQQRTGGGVTGQPPHNDLFPSRAGWSKRRASLSFLNHSKCMSPICEPRD